MINVKNLVLGIGIIIVFGLALWQGIEAFYPSPQYDKFCKAGRFESVYPVKAYPYEPNCTFPISLQEDQNKCFAENGQPVFNYDDKGCMTALKLCDFCNKEFA